MTPDDDWRDEFFATVRANIEQYGVHLTGVGPSEDGEPTFTYTTGLTAHDHPELAIWGLPMQVAASLLNTLSSTVIDNGATYGHGDTIHHLVNGYPVRLVRIEDTTRDLTISNRFYGLPAPITALQLVYPDKNGLMPWEPGSALATLPLYGPVPDPADGQEITLPD